VVIWVEPIGRQLFNVTLAQASELGLAQPLGQVQQGLWNTPHQSEESSSPRHHEEPSSLFFTADYYLFE